MTTTNRAQLPSEVLRRRLLELRQRRGWSQQELANRMTAEGHSWVRTTVAKVELGDRQDTVDELVALAFVLGASPAALVTPTAREAPVSVTPNTSYEGGFVWLWFVEVLPLGAAGDEDAASREARGRFYDDAGPDFLVTAERRLPGLRSLQRLLASVQSVASAGDDDSLYNPLLEGVETGDIIYAIDVVDNLLEQANDDVGSLRRRVKRLSARRKARLT